ncbi:MAG TPA: hypothetical protein EYH32_10900 [Anaerolineae bacterium]|nr:hypothetical protein [Anaerolineae bacterium]
MLSALETLNKIVTQEKKLGYRNKAVIGGFDKFASTWERQALAQAQTPDEKQLVADIAAQLASYSTVEDRQERAQILQDILARLDEFRREKGKERPEREALAEEEPVLSKVEGPPKPSGKGEPLSPAKPRAYPEPSRREGRRGHLGPGLDSPVTVLPGISDGYAKRLKRLGVTTIRDLLYLFPRRYDDYRSLKTISQLQYGEEVTVIGTVWDTKARQTRGGGSLVTSIITDGTGTIRPPGSISPGWKSRCARSARSSSAARWMSTWGASPSSRRSGSPWTKNWFTPGVWSLSTPSPGASPAAGCVA